MTIDGDDKTMKLFYKFKNIDEYALSSLKEKYFYFSTPEKLNDPDDCRNPISYDSSNKDILNWIKHKKKSKQNGKNLDKFTIDIVDKVRKNLATNGKIKVMLESSQRKAENRFHMLSLTEDWNNISMWNSKDYCSNFSVICIAYKSYQLQYPKYDSYFIKIDKSRTKERIPFFYPYQEDKYFVLRKIEYDNDRQHFYKPFEESYDKYSNIKYKRESKNTKNLEYNFFHKTQTWELEKEYRGFYTTAMMPEQKSDDSRVYYEDDTLDSITFGANVSQNKIDEIKDLIRSNYKNFNDIKFYILSKTSNGKLERKEILNMEKIMEQYSIPNKLYHYTSKESFLGIIKNKTLWASEILFMNDIKESKIPFEIFQSLINEKRNSDIKKKIVDAQNVKKINIFDFYKTFEGFNTYVISFSEKEDDLNQWRIYGENGKGCCIEFNKDELNSAIDYNLKILEPSTNEKIDDEYKLNWRKCCYDKKKQESEIQSVLEYIKNKNNPDEILNAIQKKLLEFSTYFKDAAFNDEKEVRLILELGTSLFNRKIKNIRYVRNIFLPYCELKIEEEKIPQESEGRYPWLGNILLGPRNDVLTVKSVKQACGTFGIGFFENWHRKLEKSKIPYRG